FSRFFELLYFNEAPGGSEVGRYPCESFLFRNSGLRILLPRHSICGNSRLSLKPIRQRESSHGGKTTAPSPLAGGRLAGHGSRRAERRHLSPGEARHDRDCRI